MASTRCNPIIDINIRSVKLRKHKKLSKYALLSHLGDRSIADVRTAVKLILIFFFHVCSKVGGYVYIGLQKIIGYNSFWFTI
jgi:hypothetical protein